MREKIGEVFSFLGKSVFFKNCVFNNLLRPEKRSYYYHSNCQKTFSALINRFLRFVTLDNLRKNGANTFVHWKSAFFSKICLFSNHLGPKNRSYYFYIHCRNIFMALMNRFLRFVKLDSSKQIWGKYKSLPKRLPSFKNYVF